MKNIMLFKNLDYEFISNNFIIKDFNINELLFNEGEDCKYFGVLLEGELKVSTLTNNDQEYTINILHKGDIFGETLLFLENNNYLGDGIITKKSKIAFISKDKLLTLLSNKIFLSNYLETLANKTEKINFRMKLLSQKSIENKIMFYLYSEKKKRNTNVINIPSKEKLAQLLNIPRPSLSRELIKLKEKKIILYDKYKITIL